MSSVRLLVAFLVARAAFGIYFLVSTVRGLAVPWYRPLARSWSYERRPPGLAMDWFGRTGLALVCAAAAFALAYAAAGSEPGKRWLTRPVVLGIARAGGLVLLVDFLYFGWALLTRAPAPVPHPAWYCPR